MRKKITSKALEKMLLDYSIREQIASIDFGTYFPLRSTTGKNPFAQAKSCPGVPVAFEILAETPLPGTIVWEPTSSPATQSVLKSDAFWLEPEDHQSHVLAQPAPGNEDLEDSEESFEDSLDLDCKKIEDGEFRLKIESQEFRILDIQTTPPEGSSPSIDVVQPNGKIDFDGQRGKDNLSNPDSTLETRIVKNNKGGARRRDPKQSQSKDPGYDPTSGIQSANTLPGFSVFPSKSDPSEDDGLTSEQVLYKHIITECYEHYQERWFRDYGEDACQEGYSSYLKYILTKSPSEYSVDFRKSLDEAILDAEFTSLKNLFQKRIAARKVDLFRRKLGSGDRVADQTSIDEPFSGDEEGCSLANTIVGRELAPDQALIIKEDAENQSKVNDKRLECAIKMLSSKQQQVLLFRLKHMTYKQIANEISSTVALVKSRLNRANVRLKQIMNEGID